MALSHLQIGQQVETLGYYTPGDGGGASYLINIDLGGSADGFADHLLAGGNVAFLQFVNVQVRQFGAVGDGVADDSVAIAAAYTRAGLTKTTMYLPAGTFKGQFIFSGLAPVQGAGMRATIFTPTQDGFVVKLFGQSVDALGATLRDVGLLGTGTGIGLKCGDETLNGFSNGVVERVEIDAFDTNWSIQAGIMCSYRDVYSINATTYGMLIGSERSVTTQLFETCRWRLADIGIFAQAGHNCIFNNCNVESNRITGMALTTGVTSGPSYWQWNGGDLEDNGGTPGGAPAVTVASVLISIQSAVELTKGSNIIFNDAVITSPTGAFDVYCDRAQYVEFNNCAFSLPSAGGYSDTKLGFGFSQVNVHLNQCGTAQDIPTPAMYANFPDLTLVGGVLFGYYYEFKNLALSYSNFELSKKLVRLETADLVDYDVTGLSTVVMDTSAGALNITSLAKGKNGQELRILKTSSASALTIAHNGAGEQPVFTTDALSVVLNNREGASLVAFNDIWYFAST